MGNSVDSHVYKILKDSAALGNYLSQTLTDEKIIEIYRNRIEVSISTETLDEHKSIHIKNATFHKPVKITNAVIGSLFFENCTFNEGFFIGLSQIWGCIEFSRCDVQPKSSPDERNWRFSGNDFSMGLFECKISGHCGFYKSNFNGGVCIESCDIRSYLVLNNVNISVPIRKTIDDCYFTSKSCRAPVDGIYIRSTNIDDCLILENINIQFGRLLLLNVKIKFNIAVGALFMKSSPSSAIRFVSVEIGNRLEILSHSDFMNNDLPKFEDLNQKSGDFSIEKHYNNVIGGIIEVLSTKIEGGIRVESTLAVNDIFDAYENSKNIVDFDKVRSTTVRICHSKIDGGVKFQDNFIKGKVKFQDCYIGGDFEIFDSIIIARHSNALHLVGCKITGTVAIGQNEPFTSKIETSEKNLSGDQKFLDGAVFEKTPRFFIQSVRGEQNNSCRSHVSDFSDLILIGGLSIHTCEISENLYLDSIGFVPMHVFSNSRADIFLNIGGNLCSIDNITSFFNDFLHALLGIGPMYADSHQLMSQDSRKTFDPLGAKLERNEVAEASIEVYNLTVQNTLFPVNLKKIKMICMIARMMPLHQATELDCHTFTSLLDRKYPPLLVRYENFTCGEWVIGEEMISYDPQIILWVSQITVTDKIAFQEGVLEDEIIADSLRAFNLPFESRTFHSLTQINFFADGKRSFRSIDLLGEIASYLRLSGQSERSEKFRYYFAYVEAWRGVFQTVARKSGFLEEIQVDVFKDRGWRTRYSAMERKNQDEYSKTSIAVHLHRLEGVNFWKRVKRNYRMMILYIMKFFRFGVSRSRMLLYGLILLVGGAVQKFIYSISGCVETSLDINHFFLLIYAMGESLRRMFPIVSDGISSGIVSEPAVECSRWMIGIDLAFSIVQSSALVFVTILGAIVINEFLRRGKS